MSLEEIKAFLNTARLSRIANQLELLMTPSIRLKGNHISEGELGLGVSKLGGLPDLPPHLQWPKWRGIPLAFIAQINLAEIHQFDVANVLPSSGILYFFYDADHIPVGYDPTLRGGWRVLYEQQISALQRMSVPPSLLARETPWLPEEHHYKSCKLNFSVETTLPSGDSLSIARLQLSRMEQNAYEELLKTLNRSYHEPIHRLLGCPDALQGDMQLECQLIDSGLNLGSGEEYFSEQNRYLWQGAETWQLLLQLDTDPDPLMVWDIEGRVYYWIRKEALQNQIFDDVWFVMQWS